MTEEEKEMWEWLEKDHCSKCGINEISENEIHCEECNKRARQFYN